MEGCVPSADVWHDRQTWHTFHQTKPLTSYSTNGTGQQSYAAQLAFARAQLRNCEWQAHLRKAGLVPKVQANYVGHDLVWRIDMADEAQSLENAQLVCRGNFCLNLLEAVGVWVVEDDRVFPILALLEHIEHHDKIPQGDTAVLLLDFDGNECCCHR